MSTNALIGFIKDGNEYASYVHYDGFTSSAGKDLVNFIKEQGMKALNAFDPSRLLAVDPNSTANKAIANAFVEKANKVLGKNINLEDGDSWLVVTGALEGNLNHLIDQRLGDIIIHDNVKGSLFDASSAEYGYLINLDRGELEFYGGHFGKAASDDFALTLNGRYTRGRDRGLSLLGSIDLEQIINMNEKDIDLILESVEDDATKLSFSSHINAVRHNRDPERDLPLGNYLVTRIKGKERFEKLRGNGEINDYGKWLLGAISEEPYHLNNIKDYHGHMAKGEAPLTDIGYMYVLDFDNNSFELHKGFDAVWEMHRKPMEQDCLGGQYLKKSSMGATHVETLSFDRIKEVNNPYTLAVDLASKAVNLDYEIEKVNSEFYSQANSLQNSSPSY